jgi:hypothetical protein
MDHAPSGGLVTLPSGVDASHDLDVAITGTYAAQTRLAGDAAFAGSPTETTTGVQLVLAGDGFDGQRVADVRLPLTAVQPGRPADHTMATTAAMNVPAVFSAEITEFSTASTSKLTRALQR